MGFENKRFPQRFGDDGSTEEREKREEKILNIVGVLYYAVFFTVLFCLVACTGIINL